MNVRGVLQEDRQECLLFALKTLNKSKQELESAVKILKEWCKQQKHLPEIPSENLITSFLLSSNFSIEIVKQRLDMYYTVRSIFPEFYQNKNPKLPNMQKTFDDNYIILLPKTTPERYRVVYMSPKPGTEVDFNPYDIMGLFYNIREIRLHDDLAVGDIVIFDFKNVKIGHIKNITVVFVKKIVFILEVFNNVDKNKIKEIHIINAPAITKNLIALGKSLVKDKLAKRIFVHDNDDYCIMHKYIPKDVLPKEFGGDEISIEDIQSMWKKKFEEFQWRFDELDGMKVNELLRPEPLKNDEIMGYYGNFKKIEVD